MAALDELISKIQDDELRGLIKAEFDKLRKRKKFGLVFESANEFSPLFGLPVKVGALVAKKNGGLKEFFKVTALDGDIASCFDGKQTHLLSRADLIVVNRLGDSICPALSKIDDVANAPDSNLWHVLIEAENFHALQLLRYLYAGKVDCIYIDPPYNTGARDWKYNNDYVDANDNYRHSKWLAMMERRLALSKELLSDSGAIFISIDDNEQASLKFLCDEIFGAHNFVAQITLVTNLSGRDYGGVARMHEYILIYRKTAALKINLINDVEGKFKLFDELGGFELRELRNRNVRFNVDNRPNLYYPFYIDPNNADENGLHKISLDFQLGWHELYPLESQGVKTVWRWGKEKSAANINVNIMAKSMRNNRWMIVEKYREERKMVRSVWTEKEFRNEAGTLLLKNFFGERAFDYPKSLDVLLRVIEMATNKNSLVLDFFAGSGTTLHAVNLLNAEDGGRRRCILVTNNEVSEAEAKRLTAEGLTPADDAWQELGIARHVTWQRTVCSIEGHDINGAPLKGTYLGTERAMADGFAANAIFFKLTSLDKDAVAAGDCFKELLAVLWLKAGGLGKCPTLEAETLPPYKIFAENKFAVLLDERRFGDFAEALKHAAIETVFIVTGSNAALNRMRALLGVPKAYRLYGDYLKNIKLKEARR